jgi:uncharacterized protein (DUF169 family)
MTDIDEVKRLGAELEHILNLQSAPVGLKVLYRGDAVPEASTRPFRDTGKHYALCQAMTAARRDRRTFTLLKEDNWCIWPLISFRVVELDDRDLATLGDKHFIKDEAVSRKYFEKEYPRLQTEREVAGFALTPLSDAQFVPDIICVYCRPGQLRSLLMSAKYETGQVVPSSLDTCASCVHGAIPVLNGEKAYNVTIPDPGEYERGLCDADEMILTLKADRLPELVNGLRTMDQNGFGYRQLSMDMNLDYARPEFYNAMFEKWGLPRGALWGPRGR